MNAILTGLVVVLHGGEVHAEQPPSGLLPLLALAATVLLVAAFVVWGHRRRPQSPNP